MHEPGEVETLKCVASKFRGTVYKGDNHILIRDHLKAQYPELQQADLMEGFVTTHDRFVTREEAKQIAERLDIVRRGHDKAVDQQLWSEYLPHGYLETTPVRIVA